MARKKDEATLRRRVVHGWAFMGLTPEREAEIRAYIDGGPVPEGYEALHKMIVEGEQ